MKLNQELVKEFYEREKHKYPDMSFEQFKLCCTTPFLNVRKEMESGSLKTVRLKFFGTFLVHIKRAKELLKNMEKRREAKTITEEYYLKRKEMITKFLEKNETT